ncbi:MAG: extracellular solute-binding protein [Oscillospiraceae bacterium]
MKAPTIKDIAREAGVSHGTVSNVLNGRGNVSVEKIHLVERAAARLGYRINAKAQLLRKGTGNTLSLIIPGTHFPQYADLYESLQQEAKAYGLTVQVYSTNSLQVEEEEAIDLAMGSRTAAIVAVMGLEPGNHRLQTAAKQIPIVLVDNHLSACRDVLLAGFDWEQAGREIATEVSRYQRVGLFTGIQKSTHIRDFCTGFFAAFSGQVHHVESTDQLVPVQAFSLFEGSFDLDCIVCTDPFRSEAVRRASSFCCKNYCPEIVSVTSHGAIGQSGSLCYGLDYKNLGRNIVRRLFGEKEQLHLILPCEGFSVSIPHIQLSGAPLEFLTVNSPSSVALSRLLPHFRKQTGLDVNLTVVSLDAIYDLACAMPEESKFDLIRMDMAWISELAPHVYRPLDDMPFSWKKLTDKMLPVFQQDYIFAYQTPFCLPYDPSTQIFFYRKDLFSDPVLKRMYYEKNRKELEIPATFEDYNRVARFFTRAYNPDSPILYGTTTAIGNSVVSPSEYLPRLFSFGGSLFDENGRVCLVTSTAVAALENYIESYNYSDKTVYQWWKGALEGFANGSAAMTVVFMNYASDIVNSQNASIAGKIGYAPIPGHKPLLGGGVVGITRSSAKAEQAYTFLQWLYSDEIAPVFTMLGGLSPCKTVYKNQDVLSLYPWLSAALESFPTGQRRLHNNLYVNFSEKKLEEIISAQVKNAMFGLFSPQEALQRAQQESEKTFIPRKA